MHHPKPSQHCVKFNRSYNLVTRRSRNVPIRPDRGEPILTDDKFDTATNPSIIIELLSTSTRNYDKGEKFTLYRDIESLQEYILVDTEKVYVEKHLRNEDNSWQLTDYRSLENNFSISTVKLEILLSDIYEGLTFEK